MELRGPGSSGNAETMAQRNQTSRIKEGGFMVVTAAQQRDLRTFLKRQGQKEVSDWQQDRRDAHE